MAEDVVVIDSGAGSRDTVSALPETYLEALSAIQEQAFIEAGLDDPDYYAEAFTLKHRLSFFKVGVFTGLGDCLLTLIGMVLYVMGRMGAVPVFGYQTSFFDLFLAFTIVTFPYSATLLLTIRTFAHITGTISRKMGFYLALGFAEGSVLSTALIFALCWAVSGEWKNYIYLYLERLGCTIWFMKGVERFFWYDLSPALTRGSWDELKLAFIVSLLLFAAYLARCFWLRRERKIL